MSEADAGEREESPSRDEEEPVDAMRIRDDRRSSSVEFVGGDMITLHSVFYNGKALKLPGTHNHIYNVVFRILKNVCKQVKQLTVAFPPGWDEDKPDSSKVAELCKIYNRVAKPFASAWSGSYNTDTLKEWGERTCTQKVAAEITNYAYELAVPRPAELNHYYKSFTSETYGETNLEQMASIIDELNIGPQDVFLDMGSGIGQLVCFTAAYAKCKRSIGIELSQLPANYGKELSGHFQKLINHFGKSCGKFELHQGDFLNPSFRKMITEEATIIFINNFAFSPELMHRITTELLQDLKHGIRIVTTKPFGDHKKDITYRSVGNINAISHTVQLKSLESGVSWTAKQVTFWLTTMDHTKLIKYYEEEQKKKLEPKSSREGSEVIDREKGHRKHKKNNRESSGHREKVKTEQAAASQHSPKWNEPDTDYSPPVKKHKKEKKDRERDRDASEASTSEKHYTPKDPERKKKKKDLITPKPAKTPKTSSSRHSENPTSHRSSSGSLAIHSTPSLPKATAPPPSAPATQQQQPAVKPPKSTSTTDVDDKAHLEAKKGDAIRRIEEAIYPEQVEAIQDAIETVLKQGTSDGSPVQHGQASHPVSYNTSPNFAPPVNVYSPATMAPQQPPPPQQPAVMQPCSEFVGEQRHTFMIPPTDPLYGMVVSYYFEIKKYVNLAKVSDLEIVNQLRVDIETEKARRVDLVESANSTQLQIEELLTSGVHTLKSHLNQLGMHGVCDVSELLTGSKDIVTRHKGLTNTVYSLEQDVALEEQRLLVSGGPEALRVFNDAVAAAPNGPLNITKVTDDIVQSRPANFVVIIETSDSKVSPSARRPRQPKPKQANGGKQRGNSTGRKSDAPAEDVDMEIQQFVQHAMKVDNAVKEKERKARGSFVASAVSSKE